MVRSMLRIGAFFYKKTPKKEKPAQRPVFMWFKNFGLAFGGGSLTRFSFCHKLCLCCTNKRAATRAAPTANEMEMLRAV